MAALQESNLAARAAIHRGPGIHRSVATRHGRHRRTAARVPPTGGVHEPRACERRLYTADAWAPGPFRPGAMLSAGVQPAIRARPPGCAGLRAGTPLRRRCSEPGLAGTSCTTRTCDLRFRRPALCVAAELTRLDSTSAVPKRERPVGRGVSLHGVWPRPRTSRATHTSSRGLGVHGHTRSGADAESRTRGLDPMTHGVVVLCPLSDIRSSCKAGHRPVPVAALRRVVKERPPRAVVRSIDRGPAPMREPVGGRKRKRPGSFRSPGLCVQSCVGSAMRCLLPDAPGRIPAPASPTPGAGLQRCTEPGHLRGRR